MFTIEAPDTESMLYWVQELQRHRLLYMLQRTNSLPLRFSHCSQTNDVSLKIRRLFSCVITDNSLLYAMHSSNFGVTYRKI